jgi:sorbitol-specific phosphotransferase system component IIBC
VYSDRGRVYLIGREPVMRMSTVIDGRRLPDCQGCARNYVYRSDRPSIINVHRTMISDPLVKQRVDVSPLSCWFGVPGGI